MSVTATQQPGAAEAKAAQTVQPVTSMTGKMVITPQFDVAYPFSDGLAVILNGDFTTGKWGYISR